MRTRGAARRAAQAAAAAEGPLVPILQTTGETPTGAEDNAVIAGVSLLDLLAPPSNSVPAKSPAHSPAASSTEPITPPDIATPKRKFEATLAEPSATKTPAKRTRRTKKTAQPIKGGWVLPHGMGLVTQNSAVALDATEKTSVGSEPEPISEDNPADQLQTDEHPAVPDPEIALTPPTSPSASAQPSTKSPSERAAPRKAAGRKAAPRKAAPKTAARQKRIGYRVTKAKAPSKEDSKSETSSQLEVDVKQEVAVETASRITEAETVVGDSETVDENLHVTHQEEIIGRVTRSRAAVTAQTVVKYEEKIPEQTLVVTKKEEVAEEKTSIVATTRKLIIFKGATLKDNLVTKSLGKIVVDASQILNPDYRTQVKRGQNNPYGLTPGYSPYPYRRVPTPEACEEVHRILTEMHGEVKQPDRIPTASLEIAGCGEVPCVLDALLRTLISGNTLMAMADAAIRNLGKDFGIRTEGSGAGSIDWEKVRVSSPQALVNSIRISGNGPKKAQHIKLILDKVYEENLERMKQAGTAGNTDKDGAPPDLLSLDYMHAMTKDQAMEKFVSFPGIGIKTAACVSLFCLRMPCFAVDTHVHKFCRWLGWTPVKADPDNVFRHGDFMVPDHLKYGLHQLFIRHGQTCFKCRKNTKPGTKDWLGAPDCPLEHLLDRSKDDAKPPAPKKPRKMRKKAEQDEDSEDSVAVKGEEFEAEGTDDEDEEQHGPEQMADEEEKANEEEKVSKEEMANEEEDEDEEDEENGKIDEDNEDDDEEDANVDEGMDRVEEDDGEDADEEANEDQDVDMEDEDEIEKDDMDHDA